MATSRDHGGAVVLRKAWSLAQMPGRGRRVGVGAVALLCLVGIGFLVVEVVRDLRLLSTSRSDNVQWTLSQVEVEFLDLKTALAAYRLGAQDRDLDTVRLEFDIFYSRLATLQNGALYQPFRQTEAFGGSLRQARSELDRWTPFIDGPDAALIEVLPQMSEALDSLRPGLRRLASFGLLAFSEQSDQTREALFVTLNRLAILALALIVALYAFFRHAVAVRRQAEARGRDLAAALARLKTVIDTALDAVVVSDLDGQIIEINPAAERMFVLQRDQVMGRLVGETLVPEIHRDAHRKGMDRVRKTGVYHMVGQGRVRVEGRRSNGDTFPIEMSLETAQSQGNALYVAFMRDISHRLAAETELVEARDRALAGERAKADFLAMMTHEIRTPLNGIVGNLSLLDGTELSEAQREYLRNMDISAKVLMRHVDSVLDVARFEAGPAMAGREVVRVSRLLDDIVFSQQAAARTQNTALSWGWLGPEVEWIVTDPGRLQQVLLNLVGNAIKFTRNGQISIEIERESDDTLAIRVIDTGPGIADEDLGRVFEDFQTVSQQGQSDTGGTGLGLGIARRLVSALGGEIGVESTAGEGSVFWISLPLEEASAPDPETGTHPAPSAPASCDVMVVEDNEINLHLTRAMLEGAGHRVREACTGTQALVLAQSETFDLILMDIRLPDMDGVEVTQRIRAGRGPNAKTPIIAVSANVLHKDHARLRQAGLTDVLPKPIDKTTLQSKIALHAGHARDAVLASDLRARFLAEIEAFFDWVETEGPAAHDLAERAHACAGVAAAFGQPALHAALAEIETAARAGAHDMLPDVVAAAREIKNDALSRECAAGPA